MQCKARAVAVDEVKQLNWTALDEESRGSQALDKDGAALEEMGVEETAMDAGGVADIGQHGLWVWQWRRTRATR